MDVSNSNSSSSNWGAEKETEYNPTNWDSFGTSLTQPKVSLTRDRCSRHFFSSYKNGGDSFKRLGRDMKEVWKSDGNLRGKLGAAAYALKRNKNTTMEIGAGATGLAVAGAGLYAYKQYKNKPKTVIAQRIAALRKIYHKFMMRVKKDPSKANILQSAASKILMTIDKLLKYLQNKMDKR